jgi:uncharacterized protein YndB with AHSA1/START domain
MTDPVAPLLEESITIDAAPERVWSLVSDLGRMSRWSPQVVRTIVWGRPIRLGTKMINVNRRGPLVWPTQTRVVRFEPREQIAFRVKDNFTIWSFTLASDGAGGTVLTQRREAPDGISPMSRTLTDAVLGGVASFQTELGVGMRETLAKIKVDAER